MLSTAADVVGNFCARAYQPNRHSRRMARALHNKRRAADQQIVQVYALWPAGNAGATGTYSTLRSKMINDSIMTQ
jgi:hypothetical protein